MSKIWNWFRRFASRNLQAINKVVLSAFQVFIDGMRQASPPIIHPPGGLDDFLNEVFGNMDRILSHHQRMLDSLFDLQREQHPILLSVGDLVLDSMSLIFSSVIFLSSFL